MKSRQQGDEKKPHAPLEDMKASKEDYETLSKIVGVLLKCGCTAYAYAYVYGAF